MGQPAQRKASRLTTIAETGDRFGDFAPYVASVNDAGTVAFQASLRSGGSGVFTGDGGPDPVADRIIGLGDPLLGSTVADFALNPVSVNEAAQLAVRVGLADNRQVILRVDPVP